MKRVPVEIKNTCIAMSVREFSFYTILNEAKGQLVDTDKLTRELECDENYLRVVKKSLQEKIKDFYTIQSLYGIGYKMVANGMV